MTAHQHHERERERERERSSRRPRLARFLIASNLAIGLATPALAQSPSPLFYTQASATLKAETAAYLTMLDTLEQTGQPAVGADAFAFSTPEANSTLFDPLLAAQRTVGSALAAQNACMEVTGAQAVDFVSTQTIASPTNDADATVNHITTIAAASQSTTVTVELVDGNLVSQGIPAAAATGTPIPAIPFTPDAQTAQWIAEIELHAIQFTAGQNPAADIKNRLLGLPTNAQLLADSIWDFTILTLAAPPEDMRELRAAFGIYGSLPILAISFDYAYILIDGVDGTVTGPFYENQPYDPIPLLNNHAAYQSGTATVVLEAESACVAWPWTPKWRHRPPDGFNPVPAVVPAPIPRPLFIPPNKPDEFQRYPYTIPGVNQRPIPPFPTSLTPTNPGKQGNPTNWSCVTVQPSDGIEVQFCSTITKVCDNQGNCHYRMITCVFNNLLPNNSPPRDGTPPVPGSDYPKWPNPITDLNGRPTGSNEWDCVDRWYY